ncbi:MAG: carbon monoxide dehydrogenase [Betaproteobacteria bacterium RIFCSPLOWO2_12_FULL_63_13]|nr:MAG: carbon monoxide dehydrogenase [Betaproteobacteria bacterium RIFCSPLOWO2_02_FULL_63_19]OGA49648.1 MAG: carbon monoxide dehydrogenase [Betaproteobacteria bacterium RIFCSPLOWO2_12_FULL_63_13]
MHKISVKINGNAYEEEVESRLLLVHFLRDKVNLKGTHVGCDTGNCGACTVFLNGKPIKSCNMLAVQADGAELTTIEGLERDGALHPVQEAFLDKFAIQCGYCTPGMVLSALALLQSNRRPNEEEIREAIEGNICMCTGYQQIVDAVAHAADLMGQSRS